MSLGEYLFFVNLCSILNINLLNIIKIKMVHGGEYLVFLNLYFNYRTGTVINSKTFYQIRLQEN